MPHYKDGSEAKVGDQVTGKLFNSDGVKAGTIISITPGHEACNALVQFTEVMPLPPDAHASGVTPPRMATDRSGRIVRGEQHGTSGAAFVLFTCADYCDTSKLTKIE